MASDNVNEKAPPPAAAGAPNRVRIFTYPKIIFIVPTLLASLVCGIGMLLIGDDTEDPAKVGAIIRRITNDGDQKVVVEEDTAKTDRKVEAKVEGAAGAKTAQVETSPQTPMRFASTQNVLAVSFLLVFAINLLIMSIDFPRFTVIALVLFFASVGFFILWLNVYFELLPPLVQALENVYATANSTFFFMFATVILVNFVIVWATRYLDYWEIMPNEILHNHGPFSDLERFPTWNLKFDKEIPDILEYALLRSGRLVLHIQSERKAIVLDNVLWINSKEEELKRLLSRMEVRVSTDREMNEPV